MNQALFAWSFRQLLPWLERDEMFEYKVGSPAKESKIKMSIALCVPRWSPIQVLLQLNVASLQSSDEIWCFQHDMAIDRYIANFVLTNPKRIGLKINCEDLN